MLVVNIGNGDFKSNAFMGRYFNAKYDNGMNSHVVAWKSDSRAQVKPVVNQCRGGVAVWSGIIEIWKPGTWKSGYSAGRRGAGNLAGQWQVGDVIQDGTCWTPSTYSMPVLNTGDGNGKDPHRALYFNVQYNSEIMSDVVGWLSNGRAQVKPVVNQCRGGVTQWSGEVELFKPGTWKSGWSAGRRLTGAQDGQWQVGDVIQDGTCWTPSALIEAPDSVATGSCPVCASPPVWEKKILTGEWTMAYEDGCNDMDVSNDKVPDDAKMIRVTMGNVVDYYMPSGTNTIRLMLSSSDRHLFSYDGLWWTQPAYYGNHVGGSARLWPCSCGASFDDRKHVAFYGGHSNCGCCSNDYKTSVHSWGADFSLEYLK